MRELTEQERLRLILEPIARQALMTGPRSQAPSYRAIRKMVRYLLVSPLHNKVPQYMRGSWRSWPAEIGVTPNEV